MQSSTYRNRSSQIGFTLTEVLIAVAIFAIIFVAALLVYDRSNQIFQRSMSASDVQQNTRVAFDTLVADLRMAGFDFDRDGFPTGENKYQQPDEQLEFIHDHAITFRTNLDYETDAANDQGRETAYEPGFATPLDQSDDYFPIVTTGNDEIVTYALVSDAGPNDDEITFYADVAKPRAAYPGGSSETLVTITGVDLCEGGCLNPPYTLYRFTLNDAAEIVKTPLADNIRSLDLTYFNDALTNSTVTPNEGEGQFTVDSTSVTTSEAANTARGIRESVQAIHMRLVGMSENPDVYYESPQEAALDTAEQVDSAVQHRQYVLESNIVPRNLGRRGMQEPATTPPGAPEITQVCAEGCGVIRVNWSAPEYGSVDGYSIVYDTSPTGAFGSVQPAQRNLYGYVGGLDPTQTYYFKVVASNSYGSQRSQNTGGPMQPINWTKPKPPVLTGATGGVDGPPALDSQIKVAWEVQDNVAGSQNSCGQDAEPVNSSKEVTEASGFEIWRSTDPDFDPTDPLFDPGTSDTTEIVFNGWVGDTGAPSVGANLEATWTDTTPLLNCSKYYYAVRQKERCDTAALNNGGVDQGVSDWSNVVDGESMATAVPVAPANVSITTISTCTGIPYDQATSDCKVNLLWDRVTKDVNDTGIQVDEYVVRRVFAPGGVESDQEKTFTVTDPDPGDTSSQMSWINQTVDDPTLLQVEAGDRYHYYVAARQCDTLTGAESAPETKFPCAVVTAGAPTPTPLSGNGVVSPYLIFANAATITLSSNLPIDQAFLTVYDVGSGAVVADSTTTPSLVTHTAGDSTATFNIPLDTQMYRAEMTMIDGTGCGTTLVRYFEESFTSCCLVPILEDPTVLVESGGVVKVTLRNQCSSDLTLNQFKVRWNSAMNGFRALSSVTYPDTSVQTFSTPIQGAASPSNTTVAVPATTAKTIPGNGSYTVSLKFTNDGVNAIAANIDFCGIYADPDNPGPDVTGTQQLCGVVSAYTPATAIAAGSIIIGGQSFVIAAGTAIDNDGLIAIGDDVCLHATLNALGQITAPTSVTANLTCSIAQSSGLCVF